MGAQGESGSDQPDQSWSEQGHRWWGWAHPEFSKPSPTQVSPRVQVQLEATRPGQDVGIPRPGSLRPCPRAPLGSWACAAGPIGLKSQGQAPRPQKSRHKAVDPCFLFIRMVPCLHMSYSSCACGTVCVRVHIEPAWVGSRQCEPHECIRSLQDTCSCVHIVILCCCSSSSVRTDLCAHHVTPINAHTRGSPSHNPICMHRLCSHMV